MYFSHVPHALQWKHFLGGGMLYQIANTGGERVILLCVDPKPTLCMFERFGNNMASRKLCCQARPKSGGALIFKQA